MSIVGAFVLLFDDTEPLSHDDLAAAIRAVLTRSLVTVRDAAGDGAIVELVPVDEAPPAPQPLYRARTNGVASLRGERGEMVQDLPAGTELDVWAEHVAFGPYDDRAVVTPPGAAVQHVWHRRLTRLPA